MQQEDDIKWAKWLSGDLPKEETDRLSQSEEGEQLQSFLHSVDKLEMPKLNEDKAWEAFVTRSGFPARENSPNSAKEAKVVPFKKWILAAAAAFLLIAAGVWAFLWLSQTTISTQFAEKDKHVLPDNSRVELNTASSISYNNWGWEENRLIDLEGEAFFEVEEGSSFTVKTEMGEVTVLGTSFNVKNRHQKLEVYCYTGKVRVSSSGEEKILSPGEGVLVSQEVMSPLERESTKPDWIAGKSTFSNVPLYEALEEIERQFDVQITHDKPTMLYQGGFPHQSGAEEALKIVTGGINGLTYRRINTNSFSIEKE